MTTNDKYMRCALEQAAMGAGFVSPNPMVGAVLVAPDGRIIGEGYHRRYGEAHAEVNAIASVSEADQSLIDKSTLYVTLEPCSHWGKTPPCSKLIIEKRIPHVVVGITDPFPEVAGRGINMLRDAGIYVEVGCLENECRYINRRFLTAHNLRRPWIMLKWAQSSNGLMSALDADGRPVTYPFSTPQTLQAMHRERAMCDAIMVGTNTIITDNPRLDVRYAPGHSPRPVIFSSERIPADARVLELNPIMLNPQIELKENMHRLYSGYNITSLMVEGGATLLNSFIKAGLYDAIRVETAPVELPAGLRAPVVPAGATLRETTVTDGNRIDLYEPDKR